MKTKHLLFLVFALIISMPNFGQKPKKIKDGDCKFKCHVDDNGKMYGMGEVSVGPSLDIHFEKVERVAGGYNFINASFYIDGKTITADEMTLRKESKKYGNSPDEKIDYTNIMHVKSGTLSSGSTKAIIFPEYPLTVEVINTYKVNMFGDIFQRKNFKIEGSWFTETVIDNDIISYATNSKTIYKNTNERESYRNNNIYGITPNGYKITGSKDCYTIVSPDNKNRLEVISDNVRYLYIDNTKFEIAQNSYNEYYNNKILCIISGDNYPPMYNLLGIEKSLYYGMLAFKGKDGKVIERKDEDVSLQYAKIWGTLNNYEIIPYCGSLYKEKISSSGSYAIIYSMQNNYDYRTEDLDLLIAYFKNGEKIPAEVVRQNIKKASEKDRQYVNAIAKKCSGTWVLSKNENEVQIKSVIKVNSNGYYSFNIKIKIVNKKIAPLTGRVYETDILSGELFANNQLFRIDKGNLKENNIIFDYDLDDLNLRNASYSVNGSRRALNAIEQLKFFSFAEEIITGVYRLNPSGTVLTRSDGAQYKRFGGTINRNAAKKKK